jgi:NADH dehydrogenase FAD-containing subunit
MAGARPCGMRQKALRGCAWIACPQVGGGPSGVETAAELHDILREDVPKMFPPEVAECASVTLVNTTDHLLSTYDRNISEYTDYHFQRSGINTLLSTRVGLPALHDWNQ